MLLKNGTLFWEGRFVLCDIRIENGTVAEIGEDLSGGDVTDLKGDFLLPGLVDVHTHGCGGYDFDHADEAQLTEMCRMYASHGDTAVLATLMTNPRELLLEAAARLGRTPLSVIRGIHLEGPFFGPSKKGAHRADLLSPVDLDFFRALDDASGGFIRLVAVDPCLEGAMAFIREVSRTKKVALGHTPADYETALAGFAAGATQVTHLFNAMNGLQHREPGLIGAALAGDCYAEVICDGVHIHPAVLKSAFAALGGRGMVISDSMAACGLSDGVYSLGGQEVTVRGRRATLSDGTLAGSATFAYDGMVELIRAGVPAEQAVSAATAIPAKAVGLDGVCGSIAAGRSADLVRADKNWTLRQVWLGGVPIL